MKKFSLTLLLSLFAASLFGHVKVAHFGHWVSPVTAEKIACGSQSISGLQTDNEYTYWCELRPSNEGRYTIVRMDREGKCEDMTDSQFDVRTFVHEYGGAPFIVHKGTIFASFGKNHAIYEIKSDKSIRQITNGQVRFADFCYTPYGLVAVAEEHKEGVVENFLALIHLESGDVKKIASGFDFYSSPELSDDGKKLAWVCWNHPNMPWDSTQLWVGEINENGLSQMQRIPGTDDESICQPKWSPQGHLYFITDRDRGWWNLFRFKEGVIENVCPQEAEVAEPMWTFGNSTYAFVDDQLVFTYNQMGKWYLAILDPEKKVVKKIDRDGCVIQQMRSVNPSSVRFIERYPDTNPAIIQLDILNEGHTTQVLKQEQNLIDKKYSSSPQHISFKSRGRTAYGFYYPPHNADYRAPQGTKPPLVVMIHGGPTSQTMGSFRIEKQFWTSRGFAVLDVNYGGSTGYGKAFRRLLDKQWGIIDVEDCENGALELVSKGYVDRNKLALRGGSAGGYTTLAALASRKSFKAGASYFGISDLNLLQEDSHKFESCYLERLVGEQSNQKIWRERSPLYSADKIRASLILFQGDEDVVVPKNQAIAIFDALQKRKVKVELHIYPKEQHGFRRAENIVHSLNREREFYLEAFR